VIGVYDLVLRLLVLLLMELQLLLLLLLFQRLGFRVCCFRGWGSGLLLELQLLLLLLCLGFRL